MNKRVSRIWPVLLIVLTVIAGIVAIKLLRIEVVQAAAPTAGVTYTCNPSLVVSANVRVVARCATPYSNGTITIYWFAYPTSDSGNASRMLSLFETAKATGSTVTFYFDTNDLSGAAYGCQTNDCRAIWAATTP
jgi:subtilase family serine protease